MTDYLLLHWNHSKLNWCVWQDALHELPPRCSTLPPPPGTACGKGQGRLSGWLCRVSGVFDMLQYDKYTNDIWLLSDCYMIAIWIYSKRLEFGKLMWWMFWSQARIAVLAQLLHILQTQLGPEMAPNGTWWHLMAPVIPLIFVYICHVAHWAPWIPGVSLTVAFWCWTLPRAC